MNIKIILPLHIDLPRKTMKDKRCYINLNNYRNWQYFQSNQVKTLFKEQIASQLIGLQLDRISLEYKLYYPDRRRRDKMNVLSIIDKFFLDSLVELTTLEDDNDKYIIEQKFLTPSIDRENPRCEVTITNEN